MALPKINENLQFTTKIPSTGEKIKYRPYLVKEEKVLLQAFESQNLKIILEAMCQTIDACLDTKAKVRVEDLSTFDVEFLFTQLRASSVGENSTIVLKCSECETENSISIDLSTLEVEVADADKVIELTDTISVEMRYPSYQTLIEEDFEEFDGASAEQIITMIAGSIVSVITEEERIDASSVSKEEIKDFLDSLTATQFQKIAAFLQDMPALTHDAEFECSNCKTKNEVELRGLSDFF